MNKLHAKIVNPTTIAAVIPAAARTTSDLVWEQIIPTRIANNRVNAINIGSPNFLTT